MPENETPRYVHAVVFYDSENGQWYLDNELTFMKFDGAIVWDEKQEVWDKPNKQEDAVAFDSLSRLLKHQ